MLRALVMLLPWLFVGGCASLVVGMSRVPATMTIGYEVIFQDLWEPVACCGLAFSVLAIYPALLVMLHRSRHAALEAALVRTRTHPGACIVLLLVLVPASFSHVAHDEAVRRSDEMQAVFMADLHDEPHPVSGPMRFHRDWRQTARLSLTLFLASASIFVAWLVLRSWLAARVIVRKRSESEPVEN